MKTLNIQLKDDVYKMVVSEAQRVDRSVRNMVSVLVEKGLNNDATVVEYTQPTYQPTWEMPPEIEEKTSRYDELKKIKQGHPRLQAIKSELETLSAQLEDETDPSNANEILARMQELQKENNDIIKEIEGE